MDFVIKKALIQIIEFLFNDHTINRIYKIQNIQIQIGNTIYTCMPVNSESILDI